jgi:3-hydroxyisobutyrate dehydrogenase-like beta-hydroxyacid dehydrogenase
LTPTLPAVRVIVLATADLCCSRSVAKIGQYSQEKIMTRPTLAFLGIGLMGRPMATRLLQAGFPLRAWNRTAAKAAALRELGAKPVASLRDAVSGADVVISMLEAGPAVRDVIEAALPALGEETLWIDMSSTRQDEAIAFAQRLAQRQVHFMDAPVSGGVGGAEAGSLAIMGGADESDFQRAEQVLLAMGNPMRVGRVGSGQVAKLCNQLIVGATINIVAEALLLADAAGADPAAVREAIRGGFAGSRILDVHGARMLARDFVPGGQVKSQVKDLRNVLAAAKDVRLTLPFAELAERRYAALENELGTADHSAALIQLERDNPGARLGDLPDKLA